MDYELKTNELSFQSVTKVAVKVDNLSIRAKINTKKKKDLEENNSQYKTLVEPVSLDIPAGSICAIIGGSGSGKTTLLNVLSNKTGSSSNIEFEGKVTFNGNSLESVRSAYLIQQDILSPTLTCRETLQYAADLKLPLSDTTALVEEIILELGLKECAETLVGDKNHGGLSGGQKRRLSIGIQLIANPSLVFLDEPTTGLDANSAYLVIKTLKNLALRGRTFIMSIHQPRSDILFLFDRLCILTQGRLVFADATSKLVDYFASLGYTVPDNVNAADYFIDISSVDTRSAAAELETKKRVDALVDNWRSSVSKEEVTSDDTSFETASIVTMEKTDVSFFKRVSVLTRRTVLLTYRDKITLLGVYCEPIIMGIINGWIFYKPGGSLTGIRATTSALYTAAALQGYLFLLFETYRLSESDIKVFDRERSDGSTTPLAFILSRRIGKMITEDFFVPMIYAIITYFMYGLEHDASKFFKYFSVLFLVHQCSVGCAMWSVSISRDFSQASLVGNLCYTLQSLACGFFANAKHLPVYVRWTKYIAYIWYAFGALVSNHFTGYIGDCPPGVTCELYNGDLIIKGLGFWKHWIALPICVLLCWGIGFHVAAYGMFIIKKVDVALAKQVKSGSSSNKIELVTEVAPPTETLDVDVTLQDLNFAVKDKVILDHLSARFHANKINAIMGPSGSGKSTLLNLISGRLSSGLFTKLQCSGKVFFNSYEVDQNTVNAVCSYVAQDDEHLPATLTVREVLTFAARLRLPDNPNRSHVVEETILEMGLKNCADTLIGNDLIKGISGGEKRRVSMAVQLLNDPKILLLDEPTSGLDSFTSASILEILEKLAARGKTIILTIHQPRAELFTKFGQILLMAKGGRVAFNGGPTEMIDHFHELGFHCPKLTNIADFVLDLISINTQNAENEYISKERVELLLEKWNPDVEVNPFNGDFPFQQFARKRANFAVAYKVSLERQFKTIIRNANSLLARVLQVPGVSIVLALYFAPLKHNYAGVTNRLGLVQEASSLYFTGMLCNLAVYPAERNYFYQEYEDRVYGVLPFFFSYMTIELPLAIIAAIIYSLFVVMVIGLPRTAENFFATVYCCFVISTCGESLGIITNTLFSQPGFVVNVISMILSVGTVMAGLLSTQMPILFRAFNYISPMKYTLAIMINYAFPENVHFTCQDGSRKPDGTCLFSNGSDVLDAFNLRVNTKKYFGITICVWAVYRALAYFILRLKLAKFELKKKNGLQ